MIDEKRLWTRAFGILVVSLMGLSCQTAPIRREVIPRSLVILSDQSTGETTSDSEGDEQADQSVDEIDPESIMRSTVGAQMGFLLYDPAKHAVVSAVRADQFFLPASVTKIFTGVAALQVLGSGFRYRTKLEARGRVENGELKGDLVLRGSGDPSLSLSDLMEWVSALRRNGISRVSGKFFIDEGLFPKVEAIDPVRDLSEGYNPGVSTLSAEFNQVALHWRSGKSPGVLEVYSTPYWSALDFRVAEDSLVTSADPIYGGRVGDRYTWLLPAQGPEHGSARLPIQDAGLFTAALFRHLAKMQGVEIGEPTREPWIGDAKRVIHIHESVPLGELVASNLEFSNNLMSELIGLTTAERLSGHALSIPASAGLIADWYRAQIPAIKSSPFKIETGSGLSSGNRVSPEVFVKVLEFADRLEAKKEKGFVSLLPISGMKGTLAKRLDDPEMAMRVWAKTGTVSFGGGLAGYVFTRSGRKLIFAILGTDWDERRKYEAAAGPIPEPRMAARARNWARSFRRAQDGLLRSWVRQY